MQDPNFVKDAFSKIADRYVVTNHVLSLGTDILWRKKVGRIVKAWSPSDILDVATGTGDLALELQKACPTSNLVASDFCPEMLAHASKRGVKQTQVVDAMNMPFEDNSCDVLTVAFGLRNMADYAAALTEMKRVIRPGGHLLVLDFSTPEGILGKPYDFYLNKVLPKIAGVLTGQEGAYSYLAGSIGDFPSGQAMCALISDQGYTEVTCKPLSGGIASIYTATA
ncbi:ubiquinone/menaquinone biosynthesis methyltransferase [Rubritalea sp.]|uniref:ubiquinone/menaquinone biosynthesis methyltransferase n=1 Tax=Rubritalea sp. TaxID=2109375 RepID=UPI003EF107B9